MEQQLGLWQYSVGIPDFYKYCFLLVLYESQEMFIITITYDVLVIV